MKLEIDGVAAEKAAERIVLAYELADDLAAFAEDNDVKYATALTVAKIVLAYGLLQIDVPEREAISDFGKAYRTVRRRMRKLGKGARLSEVMTEMHLDQRR